MPLGDRLSPDLGECGEGFPSDSTARLLLRARAPRAKIENKKTQNQASKRAGIPPRVMPVTK
jgi:hypothetical protein